MHLYACNGESEHTRIDRCEDARTRAGVGGSSSRLRARASVAQSHPRLVRTLDRIQLLRLRRW
jgi:hypothetical protein